MVRVGIIGLGNMGLYHANLFRENKLNGCQLSAVSDSDSQRLDSFKDIKTFTDPHALINSGFIDSVIIATPHYSHTPIGIEALQKGLHVMVEKPLSPHKADAEKLITAHQNPKQKFGIMFNLRTDPHYKKIKNLVESGDLGEIQRVSWIITDIFRSEFYYRSGSWRATWSGEGGGVLLNQCPHNLDLFQWICGMPSQVRGFCHLGKYHQIEVEDEVTAYFEYPNGATGVFIASTGESPGSNRFEIAGEKAKIVYENGVITLTRNQVPTKEFNLTSNQMFGKSLSTNETISFEHHGGQHGEILQNFINAIESGEPLIVPAEEGMHSLELGNAILYSSLMGKTVTLPLDGSAYENELNQLIKNSKVTKKTEENMSTNMKDSFLK